MGVKPLSVIVSRLLSCCAPSLQFASGWSHSMLFSGVVGISLVVAFVFGLAIDAGVDCWVVGGVGRAGADGPELVAGSDDAWRMRCDAVVLDVD